MTHPRKSFFSGALDRLSEVLFPYLLPRLMPIVDMKVEELRRPRLPPVDVFRAPNDGPFMRYSTCVAEDFLHPEFKRLADMIGHNVFYHRKLWEFVFILNHALKMNAVGAGKRGLGFGVGSEPLPAAFAAQGSKIIATDAPPEIGIAAGWTNANQLALGLESLPNLNLPRSVFEAAVSFKVCDMTDIPPDLKGFDFCWSSCALEHVGSIELAMDFVVNSVEKTLKIGGVAIHTTEFNLSSNESTVEIGQTVLLRRRDFDDLVARLCARGHTVMPFIVGPDVSPVDNFVDLPPYGSSPHLKLLLEGYVSTSAGLVIRRGK